MTRTTHPAVHNSAIYADQNLAVEDIGRPHLFISRYHRLYSGDCDRRVQFFQKSE